MVLEAPGVVGAEEEVGVVGAEVLEEERNKPQPLED